MRAAIHNPYLDTLGGGERYSLTAALAFLEAGYEVDLEWMHTSILKSLENKFGMDLSRVKVVKDIARGDGYDACFWVSDGSIPALRARKNFLHFQVPFRNVAGSSLLNKMKLFRINKVICNSIFTKDIIDKEYGVDSIVLYPPVDTESIKPKLKTNSVISVGRFSTLLQAKRQDVLVSAFKKLYDAKNPGWKLYLAGGSEIGGKDFLESLRKEAEGYPITIMENPSFDKVVDLYGKAKIFWSASGFGVSEVKNPEKVEHFGITVIEAMAGGAIPLVFNAGGHKEIVKDGENGFLWETENELIEKTQSIILNNKKMQFLSRSAFKYAKKYSTKRFINEFVSCLS